MIRNKYQNNCPVCGFNWGIKMYEIYKDDLEYFSYEVEYSSCSCCSEEMNFRVFPNDEKSARMRRVIWIKNVFDFGFDSISKNRKPKNWNPILQLKYIDIDFTKEETIEEYKKDIPNIEEIIKPYIDLLEKESNKKT